MITNKYAAWLVFLLFVDTISIPQEAFAQSSPTLQSIEPTVGHPAPGTPLPKPSSAFNPKTSPQPRSAPGERTAHASASSTSARVLSTLFALGFVLALFLGLAALIKRTWPAPTKKKLPSEVLELVASLELQPKHQWMLMRFGTKLLLISQQPGETRLITEISDEKEIQHMINLCQKPHPSDAAFSGLSLQGLFTNQAHATG